MCVCVCTNDNEEQTRWKKELNYKWTIKLFISIKIIAKQARVRCDARIAHAVCVACSRKETGGRNASERRIANGEREKKEYEKERQRMMKGRQKNI